MALTLMPLGVRCHLQCGYCYETLQREAGNTGGSYDIAKMKQAIAAVGRKREPFVLFGGEPLLLPKPVLEELWAWGFERSGRNSLQTNGSLIDSDHMAMFAKYKVEVGVSIDGPGALNDARWDRTLAQTRASTQRTEKAISLLCANGMPPSLIVTLHRFNAIGKSLELLIEWFGRLHGMGVKTIGLHLCETKTQEQRRQYAMTVDENVRMISRLRQARRELPGLTFTLLNELDDLLLGKDAKAKCIWQSCDPYTTPAFRPIGGHGERSKCSRGNKEGVDFVPAEKAGHQRYLALYQTPREAGGCQGCRFFLMCRGQCPGTALGADWRNKSEQCPTWMRVFEAIEGEMMRDGKTPLSLGTNRITIEAAMLKAWETGKRATVEGIMRRGSGREGSTTPAACAGAPKRATTSSAASYTFGDRLPFDLRPFVRLSWASAEAEKVWAPKLSAIRRTVAQAEWLSVAAGMRSAALITVLEEEVPQLISQWKSLDVAWSLMNEAGNERMRSLFATGIAESGRTALLAVTRVPLLAGFLSAWTNGDHVRISELLGYPKCCRDFLKAVCANQSSIDTIWPMARQEPASAVLVRELQVKGLPAANILLGRVGIRAVPHRPCSFGCVPTNNLAKRLRELAISADPKTADVYRLLDAVLQWPAEWSALHGIAEIQTPILKICGATDATAGKYVVQWLGEEYPEEGASGLAFPYQRWRARGHALRVLSPSAI